LNNLETALSLNLKTKDNKPFAITVGSLYKNGNFEMPDGMNADEVFYSDKESKMIETEIRNIEIGLENE
jgi:hypothetical protein